MGNQGLGFSILFKTHFSMCLGGTGIPGTSGSLGMSASEFLMYSNPKRTALYGDLSAEIFQSKS